jgi:hypothetical protein
MFLSLIPIYVYSWNNQIIARLEEKPVEVGPVVEWIGSQNHHNQKLPPPPPSPELVSLKEQLDRLEGDNASLDHLGVKHTYHLYRCIDTCVDTHLIRLCFFLKLLLLLCFVVVVVDDIYIYVYFQMSHHQLNQRTC